MRVSRRSFLRATLFLILTPWFAYGPGFTFEPGEYETLRTIALETLSRFPPSRYSYVGIGRSPSPIIAMIQELTEPGQAISLPASKVKWARDWKDTPAPEREAIAAHFNHYLDALEPLEGRNVLLLDHTQSGLGLMRVRGYAKEARAAVEKALPVESVAIVLNNASVHEHLTQYGMVDHLIKYSSEAQAKRFAGERYDNFAEYGAVPFYSADEIQPTPKRPEYELLRAAIREKMRTDPMIRNVIAAKKTCLGPLGKVPPKKYW